MGFWAPAKVNQSIILTKFSPLFGYNARKTERKCSRREIDFWCFVTQVYDLLK